MLIILVKRYHLGTEKVMYTQDKKLRGEKFMENNSKSSVVYQGKIPGRVKYSFAFGALGKDLRLLQLSLVQCSSLRRSGMPSMICLWVC